MLGLGDYDSPSVEGESPANADEPAAGPASAGGAQQLSIVDYYDGEEESAPAVADNGTGVLGVTLDDEAVQRATQRRIGGVQISVVKKNTASLPSAVGASSDAEAVAAEASGSGTPVAFELPPSPPGSLPKEMEEKFRGLIEKTREGYRVNEHIRNAKAFRTLAWPKCPRRVHAENGCAQEPARLLRALVAWKPKAAPVLMLA